MTNNSIVALSMQSFDRVSKLHALVLKANTISLISSGTFIHLTSLEILDLSQNNLGIVPSEIFNLPRLEILLMPSNHLNNFDFSRIPRPIRAPLKSLDISNNSLTVVPNLGMLPKLDYLNLSNNKLKKAEPRDFSPFCRLATFDLTNAFEDQCLWCQIERFLILKRLIVSKGTLCKPLAEPCK